MVHDFHGVIKKRLVDEIEGIKDKVRPVAWAAIEAVREIGNINAHMEADINVFVDVDPEEAAALIRLIKMLIKVPAGWSRPAWVLAHSGHAGSRDT
jgi:hypothetical protein